MPWHCFVNGCNNRYAGKGSAISFYSFPAIISNQGDKTAQFSTERRQAWIAAINRKDAPTKYSKICSDHFITGRPSALYDTTNPDWKPTKWLNANAREKLTTDESLQRSDI